MSTNRVIIYSENNQDSPELPISFGTFALMMYYASRIDPALAEVLYHSSIGEIWYLVIHEIRRDDDIDYEGQAHFAPDDIPSIINFIDSKIIPALRQEDNHKDLLDTYGGQAKFYEMFWDEDGFLNDIVIETDEDYATYPSDLIYYFTEYKHMLLKALTSNKPFDVWIH